MSRPSKGVFLSYAHADEPGAMAIYHHLLAEGFEPWLDKISLQPGDEWRAEIEKAIRRSGAFLSLISPASVNRGGILSGEMKLALDLRAERLDDRGMLIPVRLVHCDLPKELHDLQVLNWYEPDGPAKLTRKLSRLLAAPTPLERFRAFASSRWAAALIAVVCFAAGLSGYQIRERLARLRTYESFLRTRPGSPVTPAPNGPRQIGVTVWRVMEENASGDGACGFLRFRRQPLSEPLHAGDKLRLQVEASHPGYVYIISRELSETGQAGQPQLLFPVITPRGADNYLVPGSAFWIPPASDGCNLLELTHAGAGERLSIFLSERPIDSLPAHDGPWALDVNVETRLEATATVLTPVNAPDGKSETRAVEVPDSESRTLGYTSAAPDVVFTSYGTAGPVIAKVTLKTAR